MEWGGGWGLGGVGWENGHFMSGGTCGANLKKLTPTRTPNFELGG